jgi:hypothetical protein
MLSQESIETISKKIPAKTPYAVIASWEDAEETAKDWNDFEHVIYCDDWVQACNEKRRIESECLAAYIIEPQGPFEDIEA